MKLMPSEIVTTTSLVLSNFIFSCNAQMSVIASVGM